MALRHFLLKAPPYLPLRLMASTFLLPSSVHLRFLCSSASLAPPATSLELSGTSFRTRKISGIRLAQNVVSAKAFMSSSATTETPTGSESLKAYGHEQIQVLEGLEAVRKRPGMYIGSTGPRGLHHLVYEILDNAVDEAQAGFASQIDVVLHADNSVSITDNGRGIPTDLHPATRKSSLETVLTGREFALVVGSDNAAAVIDPQILNYLIQDKIELCVEVTPTAAFELNNSTYSTLQKCQLADIALNSSNSPMDKFKFFDRRSMWVNLTAIKRLVDTDTLKIGNSSFSEDRSNDQMHKQNTAVGSMIKINDFQSRFKSIPSIVELDGLTVRGDVWI